MTLPLVTLDYHRAVSSSFILSRLAEQILRHVLREEITNDENIALIIPIITIIEKTVNSNKETKKQTNAIFTLTEPHASLNVYPLDFARVSANLKSYFKIIARNECGRE